MTNNRQSDAHKSIIMVLAATFFSITSLSAQGGYTVQGTVQDQYGPVIGAAVVELSTSNGTSTGPDGGFSLTVTGLRLW